MGAASRRIPARVSVATIVIYAVFMAAMLSAAHATAGSAFHSAIGVAGLTAIAFLVFASLFALLLGPVRSPITVLLSSFIAQLLLCTALTFAMHQVSLGEVIASTGAPREPA